MITKYIKSESTLIMVVRKCTQDIETVAALNMAKKFDPDLERTLDVVTKCDGFTSNEQRQIIKKAVLDQKYEKLGTHAVCCRIKAKATSDE